MRDSLTMRRAFEVASALLASLLITGAIGCSDPDDDPDPDAGDAGDVDGTDADEDDDADDNGIDGPSASLQVIHEAPDPDIESVSVTVDGDALEEELAYRSATSFQEVEADTELTLEVSGDDGAQADVELELDEDDNVVAVIHGVSDPDDVPLASEDRDAEFDVALLEDARSEPSGDADEAVAFHASPDAPTVDVVADRDDTLIEELEYAEFSDYVELPDGVTTLDVVNSGDQRFLDTFQTPDLEGGQVFTLVASGFLDVEDSDRPELAMMAYPPDGGEGITFEQAARLQVVHNSPDPQASAVDISVGGETIAEGVEYRQASPMLTFVSETDLDVEIVASDDGDEAAYEETLQLAEGGSYIGVATGVLEPDDFAENPDGEDIGFDLALDTTRQTAADGDEVDLQFFHGATDAPAVDLVDADTDEALVEALVYGEFSDRLSLDPQSYTVQVVASEQEATVGSVSLDLSEAAALSFNAVVSGFVEPPDDLQAEAGLAVLVVGPDGQVDTIELDP